MLYANVYVDEPLDKVIDDWDFMNDRVIAKFTGFRPLGDSIYGVRRAVGDTTESLDGAAKGGGVKVVATRRSWEIGPDGIYEIKREPFSINVTPAGTPHHVEHVFGYWHINDKDEVIIDVPAIGQEPATSIIVMGHPQGTEADRFAWYCERCTSLLFMREAVTGTLGFQALWPAERAAVREYNSDAALRTCGECGHVNPLGYCGFFMQDTPEERAARFTW